MERITKASDNHKSYTAGNGKVNAFTYGYSGDAINRLGKFEDFYYDLLKDQQEIPKELDRLKSEGKNKTYRYKELLGKKLVNNNILSMLKTYGL